MNAAKSEKKNISTEDFCQVIDENVLKIVGNSHQKSNNDMKPVRRFYKQLGKKGNIQTRLTETAMDLSG